MNLRNLDTTNKTIILGDRYILQERIGGGSFGQLYSAINKSNKAFIAVKLEQSGTSKPLLLEKEAKILSELRNTAGFPTFIDFGQENELNYLVMGLLGLNLEKLFRISRKKFSLKTVLMLADQMLSRIESLHSKGYLHRDIKPENFCLGPENGQSLYLIDFGLAKKFKEANGQHISYQDGRGLIGTARFASVNTHMGVEQSRRDDLEAIGYMMIYFLRGELPWQNIKDENKQKKHKMVAECKLNTATEVLCEGLPGEFMSYLKYVKALEFNETPNYKYLRALFRTLCMKMNYILDHNYDWMKALEKYKSKNIEKANPISDRKESNNEALDSRKALRIIKIQNIKREAKKTRNLKALKPISPIGEESLTQSLGTNESQIMPIATEFTEDGFPSAKLLQNRSLLSLKKNIDPIKERIMAFTCRSNGMIAKNKFSFSQRGYQTYPDTLSQDESLKEKSNRLNKCSIDVRSKPDRNNEEENSSNASVCEWDKTNYLESMRQNKRFLVNINNL